MEKAAGPENAHRPVVLQEGFKFERGTDTAKDAQLLEARKYQVAEIARFFRVPLHMLDIDDQTNRSTVEAQAIDFVKYTLRPWARRIEQAIRRDLIVAKQTFVAKYNMNALLRGDSAARSAFYADPVATKTMTTFDTFQRAAKIEPSYAKAWLTCLGNVCDDNVSNVFHAIPPFRNPRNGAAFAIRMLQHNRRRLLRLGDEF